MGSKVLWKSENGGKAKGVFMEEDKSFQLVGISKGQLFGMWIGAMLLGAGLFGIGYWIGTLIKKPTKQTVTHIPSKNNIKRSVSHSKLSHSNLSHAKSKGIHHPHHHKVDFILAEPKHSEEKEKETLFLVLGLFNKKENTKHLAQKVKSLGEAAKVKSNGSEYIVFLGPFDSQEAAKESQSKILTSISISGSIMRSLPSGDSQ